MLYERNLFKIYSSSWKEFYGAVGARVINLEYIGILFRSQGWFFISFILNLSQGLIVIILFSRSLAKGLTNFGI